MDFCVLLKILMQLLLENPILMPKKHHNLDLSNLFKEEKKGKNSVLHFHKNLSKDNNWYIIFMIFTLGRCCYPEICTLIVPKYRSQNRWTYLRLNVLNFLLEKCVKNVFSGLFFPKLKVQGLFQWQEDINVVVISALSSTKPCLSFLKFQFLVMFLKSTSFPKELWLKCFISRTKNLKEIWDTVLLTKDSWR